MLSISTITFLLLLFFYLTLFLLFLYLLWTNVVDIVLQFIELRLYFVKETIACTLVGQLLIDLIFSLTGNIEDIDGS